jgi:hypothetical protein
LQPEALAARVDAYCRQYGVRADDDGIPPYPSGRRETRQHREWLALYKARRRLSERLAVAALDGKPAAAGTHCLLCERAVRMPDAVRLRPPPPDGDGPPRVMHRACLSLLRAAREAGPAAVSRLGGLLWPARDGTPRQSEVRDETHRRSRPDR